MRGVVFTGERGLELMPFPDPTPNHHTARGRGSVLGMIRPVFHPGTSMNVGASRSGLLAFMRKSTASPWLRFR
jgi:hypothetical protein